MQPQPLPGFRDFYPEDFALRAHIFETWRRVAARYGFEEYDGPPLEPLELYTAKSGEEIVGQLYEFQDKGERRVALRPEMTPTLARMLAARGKSLKKPIRWFSIPQLFRYERQQRGRLREHFQLNCDLIGEPGPLADAEIIALAIDVLGAFGLGPGDFRVRLSDRRIFKEDLGQKTVAALMELFDKSARMTDSEATARIEASGIDKQLKLTPINIGALRARFKQELLQQQPFTEVKERLKEMGLEEFLEDDPAIVRGLAYYTGTVFEIFDTKRQFRAICGGGRYDGLVGAMGGENLPCVGFGMGDVVLGELLKDRDLAPTPPAAIDVFVAAIEGADVPHVLRLAHELRDAGLRVEFALSAQPISKQLRLADSRGARFAIVAGPDERARGEVMLKDLRAKSQGPVVMVELVKHLRQELGND